MPALWVGFDKSRTHTHCTDLARPWEVGNSYQWVECFAS